MRASFNEAGAVKPRKLISNRTPNIRINSFNEAGAVKPRKPAEAVHEIETIIECFNEAGAVKPRKLAK